MQWEFWLSMHLVKSKRKLCISVKRKRRVKRTNVGKLSKTKPVALKNKLNDKTIHIAPETKDKNPRLRKEHDRRKVLRIFNRLQVDLTFINQLCLCQYHEKKCTIFPKIQNPLQKHLHQVNSKVFHIHFCEPRALQRWDRRRKKIFVRQWILLNQATGSEYWIIGDEKFYIRPNKK